jgi:hypothetical protein
VGNLLNETSVLRALQNLKRPTLALGKGLEKMEKIILKNY